MKSLSHQCNASSSGSNRNGNKRPHSASYEKVVVLLMHWEEEEDGAWRSIDLLSDAFQKYNFEVIPFDIPFSNALPSILSKLDILEQDTAPETLFIVVYAGHGGIQIPGGLTMSLKGNEDEYRDYYDRRANREQRSQDQLDPRFSWIPVQSKINAMERDALVIPDCCHAAGAIAGVKVSDIWCKKEIIAACGYKEETDILHKNPRRDQNHLTFSRALAFELEEKLQLNDDFSAAMLHRDVFRRILTRNVELGHSGNMAETPVYICVGEPGINLGKFVDDSTEESRNTLEGPPSPRRRGDAVKKEKGNRS